MVALRLVALAIALLAAAAAHAQSYPARPVRIQVGFPPGGANDLMARVVSEKLSAALGHPFERVTMLALGTTEARARMYAMGAEAKPSTAAELAKLIRSDTQKWAKLVQETGARAD